MAASLAAPVEGRLTGALHEPSDSPRLDNFAFDRHIPELTEGRSAGQLDLR